MTLRDQTSARKLRGGYYTPDSLAQLAVDSALSKAAFRVRTVLEPSAGDGAFLPAIARQIIGAEVTAVEPDVAEASKCATRAQGIDLSLTTVTESFLAVAKDYIGRFDAAFGNPPFVRFQFVDDRDRFDAAWFLPQSGSEGVTNLWVPIMAATLRCLRPGGVFGFVLPQELISTKSTAAFRNLLVSECEGVEVYFPPRGAFEAILQDVVVVSGRRRPSHRRRARSASGMGTLGRTSSPLERLPGCAICCTRTSA